MLHEACVMNEQLNEPNYMGSIIEKFGHYTYGSIVFSISTIFLIDFLISGATSYAAAIIFAAPAFVVIRIFFGRQG